MLVVLDTNHFREVAEATTRAARFCRRAEAECAEVLLSIITVQEATSGWLALINSLNAGRNQVRSYASFQKTINSFHRFSILAFDAEAAEIFHQLKTGHPCIGTMDLKIAAICMTHEATLLTRNVVDFQNITGLRVENWLD